MRKRALFKDTFREIQKSMGRFLSIMIIVALGIAFLAGIKVSAPMMRDTTDQYMDEYHMMDIRVLSTLGIEESDIKALSKLDEVEAILGSYTIDTLATIEGSQRVVKVHSLANLSPDDEGFVNMPRLIEGRWPSTSNECVIDGSRLTRLPLQIGDSMTLTTGTDEDIEDVLETNQYKIVGVVTSPYYMHFERGASEIGNGDVSSYIYIPEENFKSDIYTELFITLKNAKALDSYGDEYTQLVDDFKAKLEPIMEQRAITRYETLMQDSKVEIEKGEATLLEEKEKATQKLADAELNLEKAEKELLDKEKELLTGESKAEESFKQAEVAIIEAETMLNKKQKEYEIGVKLFETQKEAIQNQLSEAKEGINKLEAELQELQSNLQKIEEQLLTAQDAEKDSLIQEKQVLQIQVDTLSQNLEIQRQAYEKGIAEFTKKEQALAEAKVSLEQGKTALAQQKRELESKKTATYEALSTAKEKLEEAKVTLEEGKEEYNTSKMEADAKFKEAEEQLADSKEQLAQLKEPKVYVLGRDTNYGFANYKNAVDTIERIGKVFPIFFFIVAALVCLTTMTRMVDEQRTTIGTLKALGYSPLLIMSKYILYAGVASIVGSILGILIGFKVFPNTIYSAYEMMFTVPPLQNKFYSMQAVSAISVMVALTVFAAVLTTIKALREQPAELMRPKAPAMGKRILLERIPFIWTKMNFFQKVVARNIFRYKKKFFMTTIGIAGCTALLIAGLGLKQSIMSIVERQYGNIFKYHLEVDLKEGTEISFGDSSDIKGYLEVSKENVTVKYKEEQKDITLLTIHDLDHLSQFINLEERVSKVPLSLQENGVILSEKLAKVLGVKIGDQISFEDSNFEVYEVKVIGITENYIGHYMYMSSRYAEKIRQEVPHVNQLLITLNDTSIGNEEKIASELTKNEDIVSFNFTTQHAESFGSMTSTLDTVVLILIISAALLVFVVLYNLTTINISERYREIATIKVLGFNDFKVAQYIYRENIVLTLIGSLIGLILGKALFLFIIVTAEMDEMMFGRELYTSSNITAVILTFIFAMLVNWIMYFKLQKIEMVESLKSVE